MGIVKNIFKIRGTRKYHVLRKGERKKQDQQIEFSVGIEVQVTGEADSEGNRVSPLVLTKAGGWLWSRP